MPFSQALYYPWIDIQDEGWLKTALLFWDSIRTICPESIEDPYATDLGKSLYDAQVLIPLRVHSEMEEIEDLTEDVLNYLATSEGTQLLHSGQYRRGGSIHVDKAPSELLRILRIHPDKLPNEIRRHLSGIAGTTRSGEWFEVHEEFALYYMTLLATRLAERTGSGLLTPFAPADALALAARRDAQIESLVRDSIAEKRWREYEVRGRRRRMPGGLAPGLLAQLTLERIGIDPETPVDRLLEFREIHRDELARFRHEVDRLVVVIGDNTSTEALRQRVMDIYQDGVSPSLSDLKSALDGSRIRWLGESLLKIAFISAGSSSMLFAAGLALPTALLAGAGISLVVFSRTTEETSYAFTSCRRTTRESSSVRSTLTSLARQTGSVMPSKRLVIWRQS